MNRSVYYSLGSASSNNIILSGPTAVPFHLSLYKDSDGQVLASTRTPGAYYILNGVPQYNTVKLKPHDELSVAGQLIHWINLFDIDEAELNSIVKQEEHAEVSQKGVRIQLVLIYVAVVVLLFLLGFYI